MRPGGLAGNVCCRGRMCGHMLMTADAQAVKEMTEQAAAMVTTSARLDMLIDPAPATLKQSLIPTPLWPASISVITAPAAVSGLTHARRHLMISSTPSRISAADQIRVSGGYPSSNTSRLPVCGHAPERLPPPCLSSPRPAGTGPGCGWPQRPAKIPELP